MIAGLYYEDHGPQGAPPLILSAGLGGSAGYWQQNIAALAKHYRVIAYDHRGTGRSDRTVAGHLTLESIGTDTLALMDGLGFQRATIIGHAIGGMAGMVLALVAPERLARLIVINGWAKLDPHTGRCFDTRLRLLRDSGPRAYLHAQPLFLYPPQWISDNHARLEVEEEEHLRHFPGAEMIERRVAAARTFAIADRLRDIAVRTLFIASEDDHLVPFACSERMAAGVPGAQLARLAHGGHACNVTRADHFNGWLTDWLDSVQGN